MRRTGAVPALHQLVLLPLTPAARIMGWMSRPVEYATLPEDPPAEHLAPERTRVDRILLWLMAVGIALRLLRYLACRSLWLDEAYLADSLLTFSWKQLLTQPLLYWQAAPVGFLLLEKLAILAFGTGEYALRLVPLIAGLISVPLFRAVARRFLQPAGQVLAMSLFVLLDPLIYYSSEAKQYGLDVTVTLVIVLLAMRWRERPASWGRLLALAGAGAAGIFLSHPSIFVLAAIGIVLGIECIRTRRHGAMVRLACASVVWAALFGCEYVFFLRPLISHPGLTAYWAGDFMPWDPVGAVRWLGSELYELFHGYMIMWLPLVDAAILCALVGIGWFWTRCRRNLALLLLPLFLTLGAAAVHAYPFGSRLVLFLVPLIVVLMGAGGAVILESFIPGRRVIGWLIVGAVVVPTAVRDLYYVVVPQKREEIKPVLAYIRDHHRPGDVLYVFHPSEVPFRYYENRFGLEKDRYGLADMRWIIGEPGENDPSIYRSDLARLRGKGRVWVLITHPRALGGIDEEQLFPAILNNWGEQMDQIRAFNALGLMYEMDSNSAPTR